MKLYSFAGAPNPRRVLIFAAEKDIRLEVVNVDLRGGEIKRPEFLAKNASGKIPVLELKDGTCLCETVAISRYLETLEPEPNLFGSNPLETASIEGHHRHIEFELNTSIGAAWVNGPIVAKLGVVKPIEAQRLRGETLTRQYYERMNTELSKRQYVAGDRFSVADISAICMIDFASAMVDLRPSDTFTALWDWHSRVSARPSIRDSNGQ